MNFTYRSVPGYRCTERLLAAQPLGKPLHAEFALLQGHNFLPEFPHGSALLDSGTHLLDALLSLTACAGFGRIVRVCAAPMWEPASAAAHGAGRRGASGTGG